MRQAVYVKVAATHFEARRTRPELTQLVLLLQLSEEEYMERLDGVAGALRSGLTASLLKCSGCAFLTACTAEEATLGS